MTESANDAEFEKKNDPFLIFFFIFIILLSSNQVLSSFFYYSLNPKKWIYPLSTLMEVFKSKYWRADYFKHL